MAEVRVVETVGQPITSPRTFRSETAAAVQVLLRGPFRMVRSDTDPEAPGEQRLTIVDAEGTTLELFGPADELGDLTDRIRSFPLPDHGGP